MQNSSTSSSGMGKSSGPLNQNDRSTPISRAINMPQSQMSALESSTQDRDEDSQSPSDNNSVKGKCDIKQEHDIKSEMDEETNLMDTNSNNSNSNCGGGKSVNNDMSTSGMKAEIKAEAMDQGDNNSADSENDEMNESKDDCKDEPMSPSDSKMKIEKRSTIPEPIEQDSSETDVKKKCCKFFPLPFFFIVLVQKSILNCVILIDIRLIFYLKYSIQRSCRGH